MSFYGAQDDAGAQGNTAKANYRDKEKNGGGISST